MREGVRKRDIPGRGIGQGGGVGVAIVEGAPGVEPGVIPPPRHRTRGRVGDDVSDGGQVPGARLGA